MATIKEVFRNNNWIITGLMRGHNNTIRINAKTRNWIDDGTNVFCDWCTEQYADTLAQKYYGKRIYEFKAY